MAEPTKNDKVYLFDADDSTQDRLIVQAVVAEGAVELQTGGSTVVKLADGGVLVFAEPLHFRGLSKVDAATTAYVYLV